MQEKAGDSEHRWKHLATAGATVQIKGVVMVIEDGAALLLEGRSSQVMQCITLERLKPSFVFTTQGSVILTEHDSARDVKFGKRLDIYISRFRYVV